MSPSQPTAVRPRPSRVWLAGALVGALAGGLLAAVAVAGPAQGVGLPIVMTCSDKVVLDVDDATYDLQGNCGVVVVTAQDATVELPATQKLVLRAAGNTVDGKTIDRAVVRGHDQLVDASSIRSLKVVSPGSTVAVEGLVEEARLGGGASTLTATQVSNLWTRGTGHDVRAGKGFSATVLGDRADLRFRRLQDLDLSGDRNTVVVRKGRTEVSDSGSRNSVRVNRRG